MVERGFGICMNEHTISMNYMWFLSLVWLDRTLEERKDAFMYYTCRLVWVVPLPCEGFGYLYCTFSRTRRTLFVILSLIFLGVSFYVLMDCPREV